MCRKELLNKVSQEFDCNPLLRKPYTILTNEEFIEFVSLEDGKPDGLDIEDGVQ